LLENLGSGFVSYLLSLVCQQALSTTSVSCPEAGGCLVYQHLFLLAQLNPGRPTCPDEDERNHE